MRRLRYLFKSAAEWYIVLFIASVFVFVSIDLITAWFGIPAAVIFMVLFIVAFVVQDRLND